MYKRARIELTFLYSGLFFSLFWILSIGLYVWVQSSLGEGYITKVRERHQQIPAIGEFDIGEKTAATIAGSIELDQLRDILIFINAGLLVVIPLSSWYLTGRTLNPMYRAFEQQKQFASDASHEMRTPLSIISGEMELVLKKDHSVSQYKQIISSTKEEVERLAKLVENLLFLAKADSTNFVVEFQPVDVTDLMNSVIANLAYKIKEKKIKVSFTLPQQSLTVYGQDSLLSMLFTNLVDNAVKYTPKSGHIWIKIFPTSRYVAVEVKDNGIGIDLSLKSKIFDRFFRADESRSRQKGFGLGLAISKSIVEKHNGKITVHSSLGEGTAFLVYLPKYRD